VEYLDIVNDKDEVIGKGERGEVHKKKLLHRAVHILILNSKDELLYHLRTATKKQYPLHWNSSAAGHVQAGKDIEQSAQEELDEELGIDISLEFIGKEHIVDEVDGEIIYVYFGRCDGPFNYDDEEIKEVRFTKIDKIVDEISKLKATPHFKKAVEMLVEKKFS